MKHIAIAALVLFASGAPAEEAVPKNPLTEKEIAEGWIALFDGKTTFGWTSPNDSKWTIVDGMMAPQKGKEGLLVTTMAFVNFDLKVEFQQSRDGTLAVECPADETGKPVGASSAEFLNRARNGRWTYQAKIRNGQIESQDLSSSGMGVGRAIGQSSSVTPKPAARHIAIKGNGFVIRKLAAKPIGLEALLNGKNLDGWNPFPGRKSKFGVTKEGWLSVKDGPGDLQTTKQWDNFILQLECKTNGRHLNSGVFFRCLPGEFTQGYEAQIHNGFGPEKEIPLQVFDAKAGKLIDTKVKTTAMDFGTGAIYRRQPARFQAAQDNEWFTMTVVANGRHFSTWVNGLQVLDWTDHRPPGDNARKGSYLKKGAISLQGHDPTTDLLFRNIRIAELPATP